MIEKRAAELSARDGEPEAVGDVDEDDERSALGSINHDEVSVHDAVEGKKQDTAHLQENADFELYRWWTPSSIAQSFDKLLSIAEFDVETRKIYKLALPFFLQALLTGVAENGRVAIVGLLLGTREVAAFVIVDLLVGFTSEVVGGVYDSLTTLLSHSVGAGNRKLTGEYLQLAIVFYVVFSIPFIVMWFYLMGPALEFFGYDEQTVQIGVAFTKPYLFAELLNGVTECIHGIMDVIGLEVASTILVTIGETIMTVSWLIIALFLKPSLAVLGYTDLIIAAVYLMITIIIIVAKGWLRRYYCGIFGSFALAVSCDHVEKSPFHDTLSNTCLPFAFTEWTRRQDDV